MYIIKNRRIFLGISIILVVISIVLFFVLGINLGIDFKGGSLTEVSYPDGRPDITELNESITNLDLGGFILQPVDDDGYSIKTRDINESERLELVSSLSVGGEYGVQEEGFTSIGPSIGNELKRKAVIALIVVIIAIILFIAFVFRSVSRPVSSWKYGFIAVITLIHDVVITTGVFVVISTIYGVEVNALFIVALLTILGLSVNDTIVVFDRVRENLKNKVYDEFEETVGRSVEQSFARSINTSLTVIIVLLSLFFLGPESTKFFALILAVGMLIGTYSSLFLASPLLVFMEKK